MAFDSGNKLEKIYLIWGGREWEVFLIKQLFQSRLLNDSQLGATLLAGYLWSHIQRSLVEQVLNRPRK